jgi:hypothetical protein
MVELPASLATINKVRLYIYMPLILPNVTALAITPRGAGIFISAPALQQQHHS